MTVELLNIDCMEYMKGLDDNAFDLAIVDPPYGIGISKNPIRQMHEKKQWDNAIPKKEYFDELMRVTTNQIIWGGNYFLDYLGNSQGFFVWDKKQPFDFSLAMCEFAWSSIQKPAKIFNKSVQTVIKKIHPTQKPRELYRWIMENYSQPDQRILDTHLGSGSSAIAAHYFGCDFVGCELDEDYYKAAKHRFDTETSQKALF